MKNLDPSTSLASLTLKAERAQDDKVDNFFTKNLDKVLKRWHIELSYQFYLFSPYVRYSRKNQFTTGK